VTLYFLTPGSRREFSRQMYVLSERRTGVLSPLHSMGSYYSVSLLYSHVFIFGIYFSLSIQTTPVSSKLGGFSPSLILSFPSDSIYDGLSQE